MAWKNPPTKFTKTVKADFKDKTERLALRLLRLLIGYSPVDTGRFRNNWLVGIKKKKRGTLSSTSNSAGARGTQILKQYKPFASIWISNNLPYANRLNDGHSKQAPANFVEKAIGKVIK